MHGTRKTTQTRESLSKDEARRIAVAAQSFGARPKSPPGRERLLAMIRKLGLLQLDSVNVLIRSHYLPLFSRLGPYSTKTLDDMNRGRKRALFEYWGHEASLIPLDFYPLYRWRMQEAKKWDGMTRLAREKPGYVAAVLKQVAERGPLRTADLEEGAKSRGGWWGWGDGKRALEYLFLSGQVTASERRGFERIYDLTERALPADVLRAPAPRIEDAHRTLLEMAARAHGVATEFDLRDYYRLPVAETKARLAELIEARVLLPVAIEGWKQQAFLHAEAKIPRAISAQALLSPFDSLIWMRPRTERVFGFHYRLAFYTPKSKRAHGYYVMPFLLGDRLVARVDLKADRKRGRLQVLGGHAEPKVDMREVLPALSAELDLMREWLGLETTEIKLRGDFLRGLRRINGPANPR
jgi:uncharacterized protein YcaQ